MKITAIMPSDYAMIAGLAVLSIFTFPAGLFRSSRPSHPSRLIFSPPRFIPELFDSRKKPTP
jgi:hypothetical protein